MRRLFNAQLNAEIRAATAGLPPYIEAPDKSVDQANRGYKVNYRDAKVAYTASVTLLHTPEGKEAGPESEILLVQKGRGDWHTGVWGSVSGYVDTMSDPSGEVPDELFDPLAYTVRSELAEECSLPHDIIGLIDFWPGQRFSEVRFGGKGALHILPVLGICTGEQKPPVKPDGKELTGFLWVPLNQVAQKPNLSPGYITHTLPSALGAIGLSRY